VYSLLKQYNVGGYGPAKNSGSARMGRLVCAARVVLQRLELQADRCALDRPRQLAIMHALARFANIAAGSSFTRRSCMARHWMPGPDPVEVLASVIPLRPLQVCAPKGSSRKVPHSHRYQLVGKGYSIPWYSSNCSKRSTPHSLLDRWRHSAATAYWPKKNAANSTASTNASANDLDALLHTIEVCWRWGSNL
jgi:hypothetical protein